MKKFWALFGVLLFSATLHAESGMPKVTVLLTTYNRVHLIDEALQSILNQSYNNLQIIVIDDHSDDATFEHVTAKYPDPRLTVVRLSKNVGMYAASNYALVHLIQGDYITWQDSDDVSHPKRIEKQIAHFAEYPEVHAVGVPMQITNLRGRTSQRFDSYPAVQPPLPLQPLRAGYSQEPRKDLSHTRALYRTDSLLAIGGFNGRERIGMDNDLRNRFVRVFTTGGVDSEYPLYHHIPRPDSLTERPETNSRSIARTRVRLRRILAVCAADLLYLAGLKQRAAKTAVQDLYYPPGLSIEKMLLR